MRSGFSLSGPVKIVGTGLIGTSVAIALTRNNVEVFLEDQSPISLAVSQQMSGAKLYNSQSPEPKLVVVAVPVDVCATVIANQITQHPIAVVTDVASVKASVLSEIEKCQVPLVRYVGSHPMAGKEHSGPASADADLFVGRPWVIVSNDQTNAEAVTLIKELATNLGGYPILMNCSEHDRSVALVSHIPQLVSSAVAARLLEADEQALSLSGQGLRDVTRIAASDPLLWAGIAVSNAAEISSHLFAVGKELVNLAGELKSNGALAVAKILERGNQGASRIPGKHGGVRSDYATVVVIVPDKPGELGRIFTEIGQIGVNIEDLHLEHGQGSQVGIASLSVEKSKSTKLAKALEERKWDLVSFT